jgi:hypothetical protein
MPAHNSDDSCIIRKLKLNTQLYGHERNDHQWDDRTGLLAHIVHFLPDTPSYSLSPSASRDDFGYEFRIFILFQ